jgi:hypothetical protein
LLFTNDIEHESGGVPMELLQRVDNHDVGTARLLAGLDVLSRSNPKRAPEVEAERPEILRKFLESFFADRSGSII